jgi:hypothetical protein
VMRKYPQYRLEDFYRKSWREGGLTMLQMHTLFEYASEEELKHIKFKAALAGVNLDGDKKTEGVKKQSEPKTNGPLFKHPDEYAKMTEEEKKRETERMQQYFKKELSNMFKKRTV